MRRGGLAVLLAAVGVGCIHRAPAARLAAPVARDVVRAVTVGDHQWQCVIRVLADSTHFLLWPPVNHPARLACVTAYGAWQRSPHD